MTNFIDVEIKNLLTEMGRDMTLTKKTEGAYTPGVGMTAATETDYTVRAVMVSYLNADVDGSRVQSQDRKCIISAKDLVDPPDRTDLITDGSTVYNIINVQLIQAQSTEVAYICQVRV